jgi:hypothetical protein
MEHNSRLFAHTLVIGGGYSIISDRIPIITSPQMTHSVHWIYLINMRRQISCRETASVLEVTCPMWVWSWGGKGEEGEEGEEKMEKGEGA